VKTGSYLTIFCGSNGAVLPMMMDFEVKVTPASEEFSMIPPEAQPGNLGARACVIRINMFLRR
jgi:hypothetical protein